MKNDSSLKKPKAIMQYMRNSILDSWKKSGKERTLNIKGTSMWPFIREGDSVRFMPVVKSMEIKPGDICVFDSGHSLVVHRIIDVIDGCDEIFFKQKGDNILFPAVVCSESVVGKVSGINRGTEEIDLLRLNWKIVNVMIGYYFKFLYCIIDFVLLATGQLKGLKKSGGNRLAEHVISFLVFLPIRIFRRQ